MAKYPMDRIPIDFLHLQGNFLKIMTDIYIQQPKVMEIKIMSSQLIVKKVRDVFARFELPNKIVSDNGPQFRLNEFVHFCRNNSI